MNLSSIAFVVSVIVFQWNYASARYISQSFHSTRPRSSLNRNRIRIQPSRYQQGSTLHVRRTTVPRHGNIHRPMSYRSLQQPGIEPGYTESRIDTHQRDLIASKSPPGPVLRGLITHEEDENVSGISLGTRIVHRRGLRARNIQHLFRRPVSRQYPSLHKQVHRASKPMHNIFIRTKSGRKIRISHSLRRTNIVLNTASVNNRKSQIDFNTVQGLRKRLGGSYKTSNSQIISSPIVKEDTIKLWNETMNPQATSQKQASTMPEHKITTASISDKKVWNETTNPVEMNSQEPTTIVPTSISTNNFVNSSLKTGTTLNGNVSLIINKTAEQTSKGNESNVHKSMSYIQAGPTTSTKIPTSFTKLISTAQANIKDKNKPTSSPIMNDTVHGITKEHTMSLTNTGTRDTPTTLAGSSTISDDSSPDLPDSLTEDIDGTDTPDIPDIAD